MTTSPFDRVSLRPAAPQWIVRLDRKEHAVEIVYVGLCNRAELDAQVEKIARYGWHFSDAADAGVTVLADSRAEMIGVRLTRCTNRVDEVAKICADFFGSELVSYATPHHPQKPPTSVPGAGVTSNH